MAKQGLNKIWILKDQLGLICEGEKRTRRERGKSKEEKKRGEKKKKRRSSQDQAKRGMETEFMYGFYEIMYEFPCFDGHPLAQI